MNVCLSFSTKTYWDMGHACKPKYKCIFINYACIPTWIPTYTPLSPNCAKNPTICPLLTWLAYCMHIFAQKRYSMRLTSGPRLQFNRLISFFIGKHDSFLFSIHSILCFWHFVFTWRKCYSFCCEFWNRQLFVGWLCLKFEVLFLWVLKLAVF